MGRNYYTDITLLTINLDSQSFTRVVESVLIVGNVTPFTWVKSVAPGSGKHE